MDFNNCFLQELKVETAKEISQWEYDEPYDVYNFKGRPNGYLMDQKTWGTEQFALCYDNILVGQIACQFDDDNLWVGWSLSPKLCGRGNGHLFVKRCIEEIRKIKTYNGKIYLRVSASNKRAIKAYQKSGFVYLKTIQDGVAYSNNIEDFWVMVNE
ncbi:MAG: GNAT family N-acetyltransferase [Eubacteriales bacterium]|nr:GNAT family N-acetyltransferase [Eubacteriales bacterium]MDD4475070.1 GNAT family N-acetyltransferase [Eubacteriales bacterium]